uniref:(northern house mosquito) hypothetical protein n=1 Tax=Culex pipiens TaxID=7175 RepID=A0A8D8BS19_CULPI
MHGIWPLPLPVAGREQLPRAVKSVTGLGERGEGSSPSCEIRHPARPSLVPSRKISMATSSDRGFPRGWFPPRSRISNSRQELLPGRRPKMILDRHLVLYQIVLAFGEAAAQKE